MFIQVVQLPFNLPVIFLSKKNKLYDRIFWIMIIELAHKICFILLFSVCVVDDSIYIDPIYSKMVV